MILLHCAFTLVAFFEIFIFHPHSVLYKMVISLKQIYKIRHYIVSKLKKIWKKNVKFLKWQVKPFHTATLHTFKNQKSHILSNHQLKYLAEYS